MGLGLFYCPYRHILNAFVVQVDNKIHYCKHYMLTTIKVLKFILCSQNLQKQLPKRILVESFNNF